MATSLQSPSTSLCLVLTITLCLLLPSPTTSNAQTWGTTEHATIYGCNTYNDCNGHGTCDSLYNKCTCDRGYGDDEESSWLGYRLSYDCSLRTCPFGYGWGGLPKNNGTATQGNSGKAREMEECSGRGECDREAGVCMCLPNYRGGACEYSSCFGKGDCSGHGRCLPMNVQAMMPEALPLSDPNSGTSDQSSYFQMEPYSGSTWDQKRIHGCVCDSTWEVGLGSGQTQKAEFFGPDCSLRRCPSGDNPDTSADETDCEGVTAEGGRGVGLAGNLCHHECSGKGKCDYKSGTCICFAGHYGIGCELRDARAMP